MHFKSLKIDSDWQQFSAIDIEFHPKITIITGANGSGKTTLVKVILARHCGWQTLSLATPIKDTIKGAFKWFTHLLLQNSEEQKIKVGKLLYSDGSEATLSLPKGSSAAYSVSVDNQQAVSSMHVPSHRSLFRYQQISVIPTTVTTKQQAYQQVSEVYKRRSRDGYEDTSTSFLMKQSLLAWNLFGYGNADRDGNEKYLELYNGFEDILKKLLPPELGFKNLKIRDIEVVLECESGDFLIDASSGGISAILDLAWQIYMFVSEDEQKDNTVIIDEVENHLHPKLQRRILPTLIEAFPNVNFVVTTHSPLVIGSVKDSNVYALIYNKTNKVESIKLDLANEAKTATEILDEVLGVAFTMPLWAEKALNEILSRHKGIDIEDESNITKLREELSSSGLGGFVPEALNEILKGYDKN